MKTGTALLSALFLLLSCVCGCARAAGNEPITVNSTPIDGEIFSYFLDASYGDPACTDRNSRIDYATRACIRYLAVNTAFQSRGLTLSAADRAKISEETNALWQIFGQHYAAMGIEKETIYKLCCSDACEEGLRTALFDADGITPVTENALLAFYTANYIAVRFVEGVPAADEGTRLPSQAQANAALNRFGTAAAGINAGGEMEEAYLSLAGDESLATLSKPRTAILKNGDPAFPAQFYPTCAGIPEGGAAAFYAGGKVYLTQRIPNAASANWFSAKHAECFLAVSEPLLQNEINALCGLYTAVRHTNEVNRCCETVAQARAALR